MILTPPPTPEGEWTFELRVLDGNGHLTMPAASGPVSATPGKPVSGLNYPWGRSPETVAVIPDKYDRIGRCCDQTRSIKILWPGQAICTRADNGAVVFSGRADTEQVLPGAALNCSLAGFTSAGLRRFDVTLVQEYVYGLAPVRFNIAEDAYVSTPTFTLGWDPISGATVYCVGAYLWTGNATYSRGAPCGGFPTNDLEPKTSPSFTFQTVSGQTYYLYLAAFNGTRIVAESSIFFRTR